VGRVGIEPSLARGIADGLTDWTIGVAPLVDRIRLVKSPDVVAMIRRASHYADRGVEALLAAADHGAAAAEGFAGTGALSRAVLREVDDWEVLTTRVLLATWAAPRSARPRSIPDLNDRLRKGPHIALSLVRVNGYAAASERTFFTAALSPEVRRAFGAMEQARGIAFQMIRPGVACGEVDQATNSCVRRGTRARIAGSTAPGTESDWVTTRPPGSPIGAPTCSPRTWSSASSPGFI
jgi:Xaa-Pro dipeptidase